jgi:hypothetical protein
LLAQAAVRKETLHTNGIAFIRKTNSSGAVYLLSNTSGTPFNDWVNFNGPANGSSAAIFDPVTGSAGLMQARKNETGQQQFYLKLEPGETVICQLYNSTSKGTPFPYYERTSGAVPLNGKWSIDFMEGGPRLPEPQQAAAPQFWTSTKDTAAQNFSGIAKYTTKFSRPADSARFWQLNLGEVSATAEILLNGKKLATVIGPVYSAVIPATLLQNENKLEIVVANLMANRIAYMDRHKLPWKIFYNTNMPARKKENSRDGLFNASGWKPQASGLGGPVTLTPMKLAGVR